MAPGSSRTLALVPAAAQYGADLPSSALDTADLAGDVITAIEETLGGRDAFISVLALGGNSDEADRLLAVLTREDTRDWSLRKACAHAGLSLAALLVLYKDQQIIQAHFRASRIIAEFVPDLVRDVMAKALPHEEACPECNGTGEFLPFVDQQAKKIPKRRVQQRRPERPVVCVHCQGLGTHRVEPSLQRQKLALQLADFLQVKDGHILQQFNNTNVLQNATASGGGSVSAASVVGGIEQLQQAVGKVLGFSGSAAAPPTIDVEATPVEENEQEQEAQHEPKEPPA